MHDDVAVNNHIAIDQNDEGYEVWCGVDGENIIHAHIIGIGATRDAAIASAVEYLEAALNALRAPLRR